MQAAQNFMLVQFQLTISNLVQMRISVFDRLENMTGKGQNAGSNFFLRLLQYFLKNLSQRVIKIDIVW